MKLIGNEKSYRIKIYCKICDEYITSVLAIIYDKIYVCTKCYDKIIVIGDEF